MKLPVYTLILGLVLTPAYSELNAARATETTTDTSTTTDTNCATSGPGYQGSSFSHCVTADNQENSQSDTTNLNSSGAQQSMMLGMMATAAGAGMVAAGMASAPPNGALIGAGTALIVAGMLGMKAAGQMANNAGISDWNDYRGTSLTPTTPGTDITPSTHDTPGIRISDDFTREGKPGIVFDDLENKAGIDRDAFTNGLNSGRSVADMLAESGKLKGKGLTADQIQAAMDGASASSTPLGASDVMDKLGLTPEELAALAAKNGGMGGDDSAYALAGGSGASRKPASDSASSLDGLLGAGAGSGSANGSTDGSGKGAGGALSPDIQDALARNGITDLSIFQMVHKQYKTKTPMMFGEAARKPSAAENPFSGLGAPGGKFEF